MSIDNGPSSYPRYEIKRISDILAIPFDRMDDFLVDLKKWHEVANATIDLIAGISGPLNPILGFDASLDTVRADIITKLIWTDDGKDNVNIVITADTVK